MTKLLDIKDKKLLYYLATDSRLSNTQLVRKVALSKNAIKYRIDRLQKLGIIKQFTTVVNIGSIKLNTATILLKFNDDIYENREIMAFFKNHEFADWVAALSGDWDIVAELVVKDFYHLNDLIREITEKFSAKLNSYQVFFSYDIIKVDHLIEDFHKDIKIEKAQIKKRIYDKFDIDQTDRKILHELTGDSFQPYFSIAKKLNLTLDIVRYRIKKLTEKNILERFFAEISLAKLGYIEYLFIVKLKNLSREKIVKLRRKIDDDKNITYAFFDTISFNLIFVCAFKNTDGIDHLSRQLRKEFQDIIDNQEYLIIKEQILFNLFPKGLLKIS